MDCKLDGMKFWKCPNGHLLGVVGRRLVATKGVQYRTSVLLIFRMAIDLQVVKLDSADVAGELYGRMLMGFRWKCSRCGEWREWYPDEDALDWLYKRYGKATPPPVPLPALPLPAVGYGVPHLGKSTKMGEEEMEVRDGNGN